MKKKLLSKLLVFAMTVSLFSGVSQPVMATGTDDAAGATTTISGTLYDADGNPLSNKTVTLRERSANVDDGSGRYTATTDSDGKYTASVPAGVYQVLGFPYEFNSAKQGGTVDASQVCAVAQIVTADDGTVTQDLQVPTPKQITDGEFEDQASAWTITGSVLARKYNDSKSKDYHSGKGYLKGWGSQAYESDVSQQLTGLKQGTYMLQLSANVGLAESDEAYIYVKDAAGNILAKEEIRTTEDKYEVFALTVEVSEEPIIIGMYAKVSKNKWINADEFRMGKLPDKPITKDELKTLLDEAGTYTADGYTKASFDALTTAKTNAQTIYDKSNATNEEIATVYNALQAAIEGLVPAKTEGAPDIQNDTFWRDADGNIIYSQGGGIFKFDDTYYWYGVKYEEAEKYAANPEKGPYSTNPSPKFLSVTCYSSKNLVDWKFEKDVVTREEVTAREEMNDQEVAWVGRLGVAKVGEKYALFVQHECPDADNSLDGNIDNDQFSKQVLVLTSDSPTGEFKWNQRINMKDYTGGTSNTGDQTVFTDDDGTSYLVYSYGSGRGKIFLSKIVAQDNGKIGLATSHMIYNGAGREGNCMFKYNGKYYVCASDLYGWNASHAYYMVLDSLTDDYLDSFTVEKNMKLMDGGNDDFCHVTQTGFFYTVKGSAGSAGSAKDTVIFCGDRWADFAGNGLGYNQWCPLSFDTDGTPYFNSLSAWNLDDVTGEWTVHESNNYVKNGSFDADRVAVKELTGWKNTVNAGNSPINNNSNTEADKASVTGKYALKLGDSVDFDCKVSQNITSTDAVPLTDGNYNLTVKMKNSGTFDELSMYVKSGKLTKKIAMGNHISYSNITLEDITVSGGMAEVGFIAKGKANASALIDDLTFVRSAEQSVDTGSIAVPITSDVAKNVVIMATSDDGTSYVYEDTLENGTKTYTMSPIKAGVYGIMVSVNSSEIQGASQSVTVTAKGTATAQAVTVTNQGGNVTGKVVDKSGAGIAGVTVTLTKGEEVITVKTGNDGTFTVSDILAGKYTVQAAKEGYVSPASAEVTVTVGNTVTVPEQSMENAMGVIAGTVKDQSGSPVSNATVTLRGCKTKNSDKRYTVKTDAEGKYSVQVIEDIYQVLAAKEGVNVQAVSAKVTVERNQSYTADLTIPEVIAVPNGDFEKALNAETDWTNTGTRGKQTTRANDVLSGKGGYNIWDQTASFTVELNQTLTGLKNGTYVVNVKADSGFAVDDKLYVYAKDSEGKLLGKEDIPNISINKKGEVIGLLVEVLDGTLTIGLSGNMTGSKLSSGAWSHVDDFCVGLVKAKNDDTDPAVANVISLITAIGEVEATDDCKAKIEAAENAYKELTDAQKALVTNYNDLRTKREAYDKLTKEPSQAEKDQAAAQKVIDLIADIGEVDDSEECGTKITKAEAAYTTLTDAQKALVTNYKKLTDARAKYDELISGLSQEEKDQRAANVVIGMINEIGDVEATDDCKAKIEAAEAAYNALTDAQKALVTNYSDLTDKRAEYDELTKEPSQEEKDKEAADEVIKLINEIGNVNASAECKAKIDAARAKYNALTDAQKKLVTNVNILSTAEKTYQEAVAGAGKTEKSDISKAAVGTIPSQIYTGKAITPAVTVSYNGKALVNGKDYTLGYTNNTNIGTASITITGAGNYTGTLTKTFEITVSNGKSYTVGSYKYKITSAKVDGKGTVAVTGGTKKSMKSVKIAATVKIGGKSFQITSIDKNAFKGYSKLTSVTIGKNIKTIGNSAFEKCKKLKKIKISSTGLKKVGKNAIKGIYKKATIQCPKKQLSKYKKLFKSSTGYKKTMKIKK